MTLEQQQRIEQIRKRVNRLELAEKDPYVKTWDGAYYGDVYFLLSLLDSDSQAVVPRYEVIAQAVWDKFWSDPTSDRWSVKDIANVLRAADGSGDAAVGAGLSSPCEADSISAAAQTAATAMRDKCVEKVRAAEQEALSTWSYKDGSVVLTCRDLIKQLESLTLDQVKPGEL